MLEQCYWHRDRHTQDEKTFDKKKRHTHIASWILGSVMSSSRDAKITKLTKPKKKNSHEQYIEQLVPKKNGNKKEGTKWLIPWSCGRDLVSLLNWLVLLDWPRLLGGMISLKEVNHLLCLSNTKLIINNLKAISHQFV